MRKSGTVSVWLIAMKILTASETAPGRKFSTMLLLTPAGVLE